MDFGLLLFTLFVVSLGMGSLVQAYRQKLTIEQNKIPVASSLVRLFVKPNLRPFGTSKSRVTVYDDLIVAKFTPLYTRGWLNHRSDIVDYNTGISRHHSIFKFQPDRIYRLGHIIAYESIISSQIDSTAHTATITYVDSDNITHTLTIKKPYILTESYKNLLLEIEKFTNKS